MGKSGPLCPECGHDVHGRKRCVVFVGYSEDVELPGLGRAVFSDSHPCNCMGLRTSGGEDVVDERMVTACTLFLN
jgi:hypothetical protein